MCGFPRITALKEFLPYVQYKDEIGVNYGNGFVCIAYNVAFPDTFENSMLRECRGIVFDSDTGRVLRRPFHKFFNLNEKEETQLAKLKNIPIAAVAEKVDGTMIAPFLLNGEIYWGTKRCAFDFHIHIKTVMEHRFPEVVAFVTECLNLGVSPLFEFHDPDFSGSVIVIRYSDIKMDLLAIRDMESGNYYDDRLIRAIADRYGISIAEKFDHFSTLESIVETLENTTGQEGVVVTLQNNEKLKIKSPWYVKRHKVKELFTRKHIMAQLTLDCAEVSIDDVASYIEDEDRKAFKAFAKELHESMAIVAQWTESTAKSFDNKKDFAMSSLRTYPFSSIVFKLIEDRGTDVFDLVVDDLKKKLSKEARFLEWKSKVELLKES